MTLDEYQSFVIGTMRKNAYMDVTAHEERIEYAIGLAIMAARLGDQIARGATAESLKAELGTVACLVAENCSIFEISLDLLDKRARTGRETNDDHSQAREVFAAYKLMVGVGLYLSHMTNPERLVTVDPPARLGQIEPRLAEVWWHVVDLGHIFRMNMDDVLAENVEMLRARHRGPPAQKDKHA